MARRRTFDGRRVYNESWDTVTRDVFFYALGVAADNFGMFKENAQSLAGEIGLSLPKVRQCLDYLVGEEVLLRYQLDGDSYLVFRKWQDYQKINYTGAPSCPLPPPDVFGKLSKKTRELFAKASEENVRAVAVAVAIAIDSGADAPAVNPKQAAIAYYFERLQRHTGLESPEFPGGQAAGFFTRRLRKGDTLQDLKTTTDEFFDRYIRGDKSAGNFGHYQRVYNALCIAVQKRRGK